MDLKPGDAMMYLGCEADHWREQYTGRSHVQLFIHYVRAHGPRAYTFFNIAREPASTRPQHAQTVTRTDTAREIKSAAASKPERTSQPVARSEQKVGRNDPCPCGSGRKYKHCHGKGGAPAIPLPLVATANTPPPLPAQNPRPPIAPGKPDLQFQALVRARHAGDPQAITALGARLVVGRDSPVAPVDGAMLLAQAAEQGDPEAWAYLAVLAAAGVGRAQSWSDAFEAIERAAGLGHGHATRQVQLLRSLRVTGVRELEDWLAGATGRVLRQAPHMVAYDGFLTREVCSHLIDIAAPRRIQAQVHDVHGGTLKVDPMRTNTGAAFSLIDTDLIMQIVRARIARAAGVTPAALEPLEILHYAVGQTYKPHVDFFHPGIPQFAEQMRVKGQRVKTCLIYLNDDQEGGETEFPRIGVKFRGREGEALIFSNVTADGAGDMDTAHAGLPPTRGEKWLLSQWIRDRPQPVA